MRPGEFLALPTRVSRVYPALTAALMIGSSGLTYALLSSRLNSDARVAELTQRVTLLETDLVTAKGTATDASARLSTASNALAAVEKELLAKQAALAEAEARLARQQQQLSANTTELEQLRNRPPLFSFANESNTLTGVTQKQAALRKLIENMYAVATEVYGAPYGLAQIKITFVDSFTIANAIGETAITTGPSGITIEIRLKDFDPNRFSDVNTVVHEVLHGFHGAAVLETPAFEEGITIAGTEVIMRELIKRNLIPSFSPLYLTTSGTQYSLYNQTLTVFRDADAFYSSPDISRVYQLIGTAWMRLYEADPLFFRKFHDAYYPLVSQGKQVSDAKVREIIAGIVPTVQGEPVLSFLSSNKAFNPS